MKYFIYILTICLIGCTERTSSDTAKNILNHEIKDSHEKLPSLEKNDSVFVNECYHQDLSSVFNFKVIFKRLINIDGIHDSCIVNIYIFDKEQNKLKDSIKLSSIYLYGDVFKTCDEVKSYTTGKNKNREVQDNYNGEIIIADLNFDGKEDIAVINDCANSGTGYEYFIQGNNTKFYLDHFLSDSMNYFPIEIKKHTKTLETRVPFTVCGLLVKKYKFDSKTKKWKRIYNEVLNICK
jgi:hypothetical protein